MSIFILFAPHVVAQAKTSSQHTSNATPTTAAATTPPNYATKPMAFISKCNFTSKAVPGVTNGTSIAFNQHELQVNHWTLKPSATGLVGGYVCILAIVPSPRM